MVSPWGKEDVEQRCFETLASCRVPCAPILTVHVLATFLPQEELVVREKQHANLRSGARVSTIPCAP